MKKILTSMLIVSALLALTVGTAFAQDTTPIKGTVQSVTLVTDTATNTTTVQVAIVDSTGATQTVVLTVDEAKTLGLVATDASGATIVSPDATGKEIEVTPTLEQEEAQHPFGDALADFFGKSTGVDYDAIMELHEDGYGFGVITQALYFTQSLGGDASDLAAILDAKKSGDYSGVTLPDGTTPSNWGDVVKSLNKGENLGAAKSGRNTEETVNAKRQNAGNGNGNGNGNGSGKGNGNGNNGGNGNGNGGGNGGGGNGKGGGKP